MKGLRVVLGIAISVALLAFLLWRVDRHALAEQLARTHWGWTGLGAALAPIGLWMRARRWRYLFPPRSEPPGLVPAIMIGYMVNNLLPLRAGEVVRVYVVARRWGRGFWTALATVVVERVLDSLAIVLILSVLMLLIPVPAIVRWGAVLMLSLELAAVMALALLATAPATCARAIGRLTRPWPRLGEWATRTFDRFVHGLDGIRTPAHALPLMAWTILVWLPPALAAWTILRALDLDLPLIAGLTVLAFVGLSISIPSAPGYLGVFHGAAILALAIFDVPHQTAMGYALLFHASQYIPVTVVGWLFLLREQMSLGEATRARSAPTASEA